MGGFTRLISFRLILKNSLQEYFHWPYFYFLLLAIVVFSWRRMRVFSLHTWNTTEIDFVLFFCIHCLIFLLFVLEIWSILYRSEKKDHITYIFVYIYIYIYIYSGFMYFSKLFHIEKWMGFFCSKCDWWLKSRNDVKRKCLHFLNSDLVGEMSFPHRMFSRGFSRLPWNIQMQSGTTKTETDWEIDYTRGPQQSATYIFSCYYMFKPHFLVLLLLNIVLYINFFVLDILYSSYLHVCCT